MDSLIILSSLIIGGAILIRIVMYLIDQEKLRKEQIKLLKEIKDGIKNSKS
jgi:hypothetical protein